MFATSPSQTHRAVPPTVSPSQSAIAKKPLAVLDAVREVKPPFSPESVVAEFAGLLKYYRINAVTGDRYAGEWPREQFRKLGIQYELSQKPKSDLYRDFLPLVNSRQVDLLDLPRAIAQLISLERRTARGGRDSIDHPPGTHDDIANAIAGLVVRTGGKPAYDSSLAWVGNGDVNIRDCRQREFMRYVASGGQRRP